MYVKRRTIRHKGISLGFLQDFLGDVDPITFISDRQKGLVNVLAVKWPTARSRNCARHVCANFR